MELNNKSMGALLFLAGVTVGVNYPKIKKQLQPAMKTLGKKSGDAYGSVSKFFASQKESVKDLLAKTKIRKPREEKKEAEKDLLAKTRRIIKPREEEQEAEVKVGPVEEAIEEVAEEEMPPEMSLKERVLEFIERHPKGVKVGDMEEPLGVLRMRLGVVAKGLLEKGKVIKEENLYFPL